MYLRINFRLSFVGHPNGHTILTEEVTAAIKMSYPAVQISLDKFGLSKDSVTIGMTNKQFA